MPFLVFADDEDKCRNLLAKIKEMGVDSVLADNIGTFAMAKKLGFRVFGGHGLNVLNSVSFSEYENMGAEDITLSPELMMSSVGKIRNRRKKGIIGYGYLPLMRFRVCPAQSKKGCADCRGLSVVKDRLGIDFYILCSGRKYSSLLNSVPLYIGDKPHDNADFVTLYFTFEKKEN